MYFDTSNNYKLYREKYLNNANIEQVSNELIEEAYESAKSLIDAYLNTSYNVPFEDYPNTPEIIQTIHNQLVLYFLHVERGVGYVRVSKRAIEIGYENSIELLGRLSAGGYKDANGNWVKVTIPNMSRKRKFGIITGTDGLYTDRKRGQIFGLNPNNWGFCTDDERDEEPSIL
jgi:phage gp36-like protein